MSEVETVLVFVGIGALAYLGGVLHGLWNMRHDPTPKLGGVSFDKRTRTFVERLKERIMTIRVCPERDGRCPHGMDCPFSKNQYSCHPGWRTLPEASRETVGSQRMMRNGGADIGSGMVRSPEGNRNQSDVEEQISMEKSATQIAQETYERDHKESRLHWMHKTFAEKYAPEDIPNRDLFYADLSMLLREVQIDALAPFHEAAAHQMAMRPIPPIVLKTVDDT